MHNVIIIGAGAAGLFCAAEVAKRGCSVLVIDHAKKIGEKIRISGGGRCNFTNINTSPKNFICNNPKFPVSALSRYQPKDFIKKVDAAKIAWHEKKLGQLFCNDSANQIVDMLLTECRRYQVDVQIGTDVKSITKSDNHFDIITSREKYQTHSVVIATGGKSIPKIGATGFGYEIAEQFGLSIIPTRAGLVPLTFEGPIKDMAKQLSGVSIEARVSTGKASFQEGFLFTHRGLSGPSILQISNYWQEGETLSVNLCPDTDLLTNLKEVKKTAGRKKILAALTELLPKRVAQSLSTHYEWRGNLAEWSDKKLLGLADTLQQWQVIPSGSEGYRTAEVTLGGVDTNVLDSKTMMAKPVPGLYFIGEVVDVTGWLGGYNFQWAWASAFAAAEALAQRHSTQPPLQ